MCWGSKDVVQGDLLRRDMDTTSATPRKNSTANMLAHQRGGSIHGGIAKGLKHVRGAEKSTSAAESKKKRTKTDDGAVLERRAELAYLRDALLSEIATSTRLRHPGKGAKEMNKHGR